HPVEVQVLSSALASLGRNRSSPSAGFSGRAAQVGTAFMVGVASDALAAHSRLWVGTVRLLQPGLAAVPHRSARPLWSASQATPWQRTRVFGSEPFVSFSRVERPCGTSRHGLYGRRRKRRAASGLV